MNAQEIWDLTKSRIPDSELPVMADKFLYALTEAIEICVGDIKMGFMTPEKTIPADKFIIELPTDTRGVYSAELKDASGHTYRLDKATAQAISWMPTATGIPTKYHFNFTTVPDKAVIMPCLILDYITKESYTAKINIKVLPPVISSMGQSIPLPPYTKIALVYYCRYILLQELQPNFATVNEQFYQRAIANINKEFKQQPVLIVGPDRIVEYYQESGAGII